MHTGGEFIEALGSEFADRVDQVTIFRKQISADTIPNEETTDTVLPADQRENIGRRVIVARTSGVGIATVIAAIIAPVIDRV